MEGVCIICEKRFSASLMERRRNTALKMKLQPSQLASPKGDLRRAKIALFTTGGLVPVGNPDKIKQAFATSYGVYEITGLEALKKGEFESIHGGYDTTFVSSDPHRLVPLDVLRDCVEEGVIGELYPFFGATCGVGTNVAAGQKMGADWAKRLKNAGVTAAILTST